MRFLLGTPQQIAMQSWISQIYDLLVGLADVEFTLFSCGSESIRDAIDGNINLIVPIFVVLRGHEKGQLAVSVSLLRGEIANLHRV